MSTSPKCFAKLETPEGTYELTKAEADQLRMLLGKRKQLGVTPEARPPVSEADYDRLYEFLREHLGDDGYLGEVTRGGGPR